MKIINEKKPTCPHLESHCLEVKLLAVEIFNSGPVAVRVGVEEESLHDGAFADTSASQGYQTDPVFTIFAHRVHQTIFRLAFHSLLTPAKKKTNNHVSHVRRD